MRKLWITALVRLVNFLSVRIASRISTDFSATLRGQVFEKVQMRKVKS